MADIGSYAITDAAANISQSVESISDVFQKGITSSSGKIETNVQGIYDSLGGVGWFTTTLEKILDNTTFLQKEKNQQSENEASSIENIKDMIGINNNPALAKNDDKDSTNTKTQMTPSKVEIKDIAKLKTSSGLGFAILYWKLDEIAGLLGKPKDDKDEKKGIKASLGNIFKDLTKGIGGLASLGIALIAFAGAMTVFKNVEWGSAIIGLSLFSAFVLGSIGISKLMGDNKKQFDKFAAASLSLAAALGVFSLSLLIASNVFSGKPIFGMTISLPGAIGALVSFGVFIASIALISRLMTSQNKNFVGFAKSAVIMSVGLLTFSISLAISSQIFHGGLNIGGFNLKVDLLGALGALVSFAIFINSFSTLAIEANKEKSNFGEFVTSTILMSVSLLSFAFSLAISSQLFSGDGLDIFGVHLKVKLWSSIGALSGFAIFINSFISLAKVANEKAPDLLKFVGTTILMAASLASFALSVWITGAIFSGEEFTFLGHTYKANIGYAIGGLLMFAVFITGFTGLAILANTQAPNILVFTATTLLMSVSLVAFGLAASIVSAMISGDEVNVFGMKLKIDIASAFIGLGMMGVFLLGFTALGLIASQVAVPILIFTATTILMSVSLVAFGLAITTLSTIVNKVGDTKPYLEFIKFMGDVIWKFGWMGIKVAAAIPGMILLSPTLLLMSTSLNAFGKAILTAKDIDQVALNNTNNVISGMSKMISSFAKMGVVATVGLITLIPLLTYTTTMSIVVKNLKSAITSLSEISKLVTDTGLDSTTFNVLSSVGDDIKKFSGSLKSLSIVDVKKLQSVNTSLSGIANASASLDPLIDMANKSGNFASIADSFERIRDSLKDIDDNSYAEKMSNSVNRMGIADAQISTEGNKAQQATNTILVNDSKEAVNAIYHIMKKWEDGVPIKGQPDKSTAKETYVNAYNLRNVGSAIGDNIVDKGEEALNWLKSLLK